MVRTLIQYAFTAATAVALGLYVGYDYASDRCDDFKQTIEEKAQARANELQKELRRRMKESAAKEQEILGQFDLKVAASGVSECDDTGLRDAAMEALDIGP